MKQTAEQIANQYYKSIKDVLLILGHRDRKTIYTLIEEGEIKGMKILGRYWIHKQSVADFLQRKEKEAFIY